MTKDTIVNQCVRNFVVKFITMKNFVLILSVFAATTACKSPEPEVITLPTTVHEKDSVVANASQEVFISGILVSWGVKERLNKS